MRQTSTILFFLVSLFSFSTFSQQMTREYPHGLYIGFNAGGAWQTSDIEDQLGYGLGGNLEWYLTRKETSILGLSARGSYLFTKTSGQNNTASTQFSDNYLVNGSLGPNYTGQSSVFYNYETETHDLSLQLALHAHQLRQKGVLLYGFGGLGLTGYDATTNLLNSSGTIYDFSSLGTITQKTSLDQILDGTSETSLNNGSLEWVATPTLGLGIGFNISPSITFGAEYRTLFSLTNQLDANRFNVNQETTNNDKYHYLSLGFGFKIGGGSANTTTTPTVGKRPVIQLRNNTSPVSRSAACYANIALNIYNITTKNEIKVLVNGEILDHAYYSYKSKKGKTSIGFEMQADTVYIDVIAQNIYGKDSLRKTYICDYTAQQIRKYSPKINAIQPNSNFYTTYDCEQEVVFQTKNITKNEEVSVLIDGDTLSNHLYSFSPSTHKVSIHTIIKDTSIIKAYVKNTYGDASDQVSIYCNTNAPIVKLSSPNQNIVNDFKVQATFKLENVGPNDQISVYENGQLMIGNYYVSSDQSNVTIRKSHSIDGQYEYTVSVTSKRGNSSDSIIYNVIVPKIPEVSFISNQTSYQRCFQNIKLTTKNITNRSQITITVNGFKNNRFEFNPSTGIISFNHLIPSFSSIEVIVKNDDAIKVVNKTISCGQTTGTGTSGSGTSTGNNGGGSTSTGNKTGGNSPTIVIKTPLNTTSTVACGSKQYITADISDMAINDDLEVYVNGIKLNKIKYTYFVTTGKFKLYQQVNSNTVIQILATNSNGSTTKVVKLNCNTQTYVPTVQIIANKVDPKKCEATILANITNITYKSDIKVYIGGNQISSVYYTYSNGKLSICKEINGSQTVKIVATNKDGTASNELTLNCNKITTTPTVSIISNKIDTSKCEAIVTANITNITFKSDIKVFVDGTQISSVYYTFSNGKLVICKILNGNQVIKIVATNKDGTANDAITLNCKISPPPTVTNIKQDVSKNCVLDFSATVSGISSPSDIEIYHGARKLSMSEFNYNTSNNMVTSQLKIRTSDIIKLIAKNKFGSKTEIIKVGCTPVVNKPIITEVSSSSVDCIANATYKVEHASKNEIQVLLNNGTSIPFSFSNGLVKLSGTPITKNSFITIKVSTKGGNTETHTQFNCSPKVVTPPKIKVLESSTTNCMAIAKFKVDNALKSDIMVSLNNSKAIPFTYSNGYVSVNNLQLTKNSVLTIKVSTIDGSDEKKVNLNCLPVVSPTVTISTPFQSPLVVTTCESSFTATTKEITSKDQIKVWLDGTNVPFTFENNQVKANLTNLTQNSTIKITVTNSAGTDTKSTIIKCFPKPTITEVSSSSIDCIANATYKVAHASKNEIQVLLNDGTLIPFTFSNGLVKLSGTPITKNSFITIKVSTKGGNTETRTQFNCTPKVVTPPKIKVLESSTTNCIAIAKFKVENALKSDIMISLNNSKQIPFSYSNGYVSVNNLQLTKNSVLTIKVSTIDGSDEKKVSLNCQPVINPTVTISTPSQSPLVVTTCESSFTATTKEITSKDQVQVLLDGTNVPFTFENNQVEANITNITQNSTVKITVTNSAGTDTKPTIIKCIPKPTITEVSSNTDECTINATYKVTETSKNNISVKLAGQSIPFTFINNELKIVNQKITTKTTLEIEVKNESGSQKISKLIDCNEDLDFDITDGEVIPNQNYKVEVTVIGCALKAGGNGADYPVQVQVYLNNKAQNPFGDYTTRNSESDVNNGKQHHWTSSLVAANSPIRIKAKSFSPTSSSNTPAYEQDSKNNSKMVVVLRNGDAVPETTGFQGQSSAEEYLKPYIKNNKISLDENQAIYLFELGTSKTNVQWYDLQDCVVLVSLSPSN